MSISTAREQVAASAPARVRQPLISLAQDAVLVVVFLAFAVVHTRYLLGGVLTSLPFALENGLLAGIYLTRRRSVATSTRAVDWVAATVGGWLPLAMQVHPAETAWLQPLGVTVQLAGLSLTILCFAWLGRSFGIVAANRGVKTSGPYRVVRHPIYLTHFITMSGFLLANPGWLNLGLLSAIAIAQLMRIRGEERVLVQDPAYRTYTQTVRWRLVPRVF